MESSERARREYLLRHALAYQRMGLRVHPLKAGEKVPATRRGLHDATTDQSVARGWWKTADYNMGIRTGEGLVVVDVDPRHGGDDTLHSLEQSEGALPPTWRQQTGGGGEQIFFLVDGPCGCSVGKLGPGLDVRGDGGYIVAPPSIHPSGREYAWDVSPSEVELAPLPDWLRNRMVDPDPAKPTAEPAETWRRIVGGVGEGERNASAARIYGHLLSRRVDPIVGLELMVAWDSQRNRPPLGRAEVEKVCESIAARELRKRDGLG